MGEDAGGGVGYEGGFADGGCDACGEPGCEVRAGFDACVGDGRGDEGVECGREQSVRVGFVLGRSIRRFGRGTRRSCDRLQNPQFVPKRRALLVLERRVGDGPECAPETVHTDVFVNVRSIVGRRALELFQAGCKLFEFGESSTAFGFDSDFDLADPASLEFDALGDDFLF